MTAPLGLDTVCRLLTLALAALVGGCSASHRPPADTVAPALVRAPSDSPIVELRLVFRAGSAFDPPGKEGLAWLLAHAMVEGGGESLPAPAMKRRLHRWAAQLKVQVDKEQLTFSARCHRDHLASFYPLLVDVLLRPRLASADFERLRDRARSHLVREVRTGDAEALSKLALEAVVFAGHPYAHPPVGTAAGLDHITHADLAAHRGRVLTLARLSIGLAGAADAALGDRLRADLAAHLPAGTPPPPLPPPPAPRRQLVLVEQPGAPATAISIGHALAVDRAHPDHPALALAASYFGEHRLFHGVLFQSMRSERGMNYGDYAYVEAFRQDGWTRFARTNIARTHQLFSLWIRPVPHADRHFALRIALWNLQRLVQDGPSPAEVANTRAFVTGYSHLKEQSDMRRLGTRLDDVFYRLERPYHERLRARIATLSAAEVHAAIRRHIHPDRVTIVIVTADTAPLAAAIAGEVPSPKRYDTPPAERVRAEDETIARLELGLSARDIVVVPAAALFER